MGIRKRKNGEGSITLRSSDGRYSVSLGDIHTTAKDLKSAKAKLKELKASVARGEPATVKRLTVEVYMSDWLENYKKNSVKPASYERLTQTFENQVVKNIGHLQMQAVKADDIQRMVNAIYSEKSYSTTKKAFDFVNECMRDAVLKRQIIFNPCEGVKLPKKPTRTVDDEEKFYYTEEQVRAIVTEATAVFSNGTPKYRYGQVIILLLATGMREGEPLYLKWKNVDFENKCLRVCGNVVEVDGGIIEQDTPKTTKSNRVIPLNDNAVRALTEIKDIINDDERVVATKNGKAVSPSSIRRTMKSIIKNCDVKGISDVKDRVHALRHTFAATLIRNGADIKVVSEILGHEDVTTTLKIYHHVIEEQKRDVVTAIDNIF